MCEECEKDYVTVDQLQEEIGKYLKRIMKPEYCPNCKELQNMLIIYHVDGSLRGFAPRVTESLRCPGCLKLFENKLEEVNNHKSTESKEHIGFGLAAQKTTKKPEEKTDKVKKEDENESQC